MFFTILGILIGIIGIIIPIIHSKKKYVLSYTESVNRLYLPQKDGDVKIIVQYQGQDTKLPLAMTKLVIKNSGKRDIVFNQRFTHPIEIKSSGIEVIDFNTLRCDPSIAPNVTMENNSINLSWDILKKNEKIIIDIIGRLTDMDKIEYADSKCFDFQFRAADINKIKHRPREMGPLKLVTFSGIVFFFLTFVLLFPVGSLREESLVGDIVYNGEEIHNATVLYNMFTDRFFISTTSKRVERYIPSQDVKSITISGCRLPSSYFRIINLSFVAIFFIFLILILVYIYIQIKRRPSYMNNVVFVE